jgi:hypothetical protein
VAGARRGAKAESRAPNPGGRVYPAGEEARMRGSAFMASLPDAINDREPAVVEAVKGGGVALPVVWAPVSCSAGGHTGTFWVSSDTLRFGELGANGDPSDWDWVRLAVSATGAQQIADLLGVLLPTDRIADLTHAAAAVKLTPHPMPIASDNASLLKHHTAVEAERQGRDGLLSTVGKEWILGNELLAHPLGKDGAINYGWHSPGPATAAGPYHGRAGFVVWQQRGFKHNRFHADYSQWVPRLVHPRMLVDGAEVPTADVMGSTELAGLVSYDGPLKATRYQAVAPLDCVAQPPALADLPAPAVS